MQSTDWAVAQNKVQLTVAECLSRIPCLLILPHWLQLMGTPNPWWFNQCNDGRLARYFTTIYCKRDGVLLMTPLPLSPHPPFSLSLSFPWPHFFHQQTTHFNTCTQTVQPFHLTPSLFTFPPRSLPSYAEADKQNQRTQASQTATLQTRLHLCIMCL